MNIQELLESVELANALQINDEFDLELSEDTVIETAVVDILEDGVVVELDQKAVSMLAEHGLELDVNDSLTEENLDSQAVEIADKLTTEKNLEKLRGMAHDSTVYRALDRYFAKHGIPETIYNRVANIVFSRIKNIKRAIAGWGAFDKDKPSDIVNRTKSQDTATLKGLSNRGPTGKGSPAELQQKAIKRELKRRGEQDVAEGLEDSNIQSVIIDTVERLFRRNNIGDYDSLEAVRQGVKHHFSKPGANVDSAIEGILNILSRRMRKQGNYNDLSRFKDALSQGIRHQLKKQGVTEGLNDPNIQMEAEYQGRKVSLGKPFLTPDGPKKRSVYVRKPNGRVVKVNFGDKKMKIKKSNPQRRKSFRARHRCANPGPRTSARYWSCKFW